MSVWSELFEEMADALWGMIKWWVLLFTVAVLFIGGAIGFALAYYAG